jgi:ABC-2 type transport system permease protein
MMMQFAFLDYLSQLRERKTWLAAAPFSYAIFTTPLLLTRPPAHVQTALAAWFGNADSFTLFMYIWIDLALNKMIVFLPVILASGVVLRERDMHILEVLAAKPMSMVRYFTVRTTSACAVMATLYVVSHLAGILWFTRQVDGFRATAFLAASFPHLFAAIFGTALTASIAVFVRRRGLAALVAIVVLSIQSSLALIGFYQPAWRRIALVNPYAFGGMALRHLDALTPGVILLPIIILTILSAAAIAAGAFAVRRFQI